MQFANEQFVSAGYTAARSGMSLIRPFELMPGQMIYRFYDSSKAATPEAGANGAWWMEFESFQQIRHFALRHGYSFSYAARLFAAILYEWSEVNAFVRCRVTKPLKAFKGRGKQVESTGADARDLPRMTPMQSVLEVYQLYLPGVGGPASIADSVLKVAGGERIY